MLLDEAQQAELAAFMQRVIANDGANNGASPSGRHAEPIMPIFADAENKLVFDASRAADVAAAFENGKLSPDMEAVRAYLDAWRLDPPNGTQLVGLVHGHERIVLGTASMADVGFLRKGGGIDPTSGRPRLDPAVLGTVAPGGGTTFAFSPSVASDTPPSFFAQTMAGANPAIAPTCAPDDLADPLRGPEPRVDVPTWTTP